MSSVDLIGSFKVDKLLNQDQGGRRLIVLGIIHNEPALLLVERGAFDTDDAYLNSLPHLVTQVKNLGDNDVYRWYLANSLSADSGGRPTPPDLKINIIYPCTPKHIKKYSFQQGRSVVETPEIYRKHVLPYMKKCREEGRLNWVFNIIEGRSEQENVLFRSQNTHKKDDFLLLPDLNWDRKTIGGLHLLALVERRDIWSVRDLKKRDASWLRGLRSVIAKTATELYKEVEEDMLKFYVHYQPTYYHFHIHIVHVNLDPTATQATGKALGLGNIISQLETMAGGDDAGMADVELTYGLGEASELWEHLYLPLKEGREPDLPS